jgi:hypothetical protein
VTVEELFSQVLEWVPPKAAAQLADVAEVRWNWGLGLRLHVSCFRAMMGLGYMGVWLWVGCGTAYEWGVICLGVMGMTWTEEQLFDQVLECDYFWVTRGECWSGCLHRQQHS